MSSTALNVNKVVSLYSYDEQVGSRTIDETPRAGCIKLYHFFNHRFVRQYKYKIHGSDWLTFLLTINNHYTLIHYTKTLHWLFRHYSDQPIA